jgi:hypothetical protein
MPAAIAPGQGKTDDAMQRHTLTPSLPPLHPKEAPLNAPSGTAQKV